MTENTPMGGSIDAPVELAPTADAVTSLVGAIPDSGLDDRTPCDAYAVRDLLAHVLGLSVAFRDAARKELGPTTEAPPSGIGVLPEGWRELIPAHLTELAAAWRDPRARQGMTKAGGIDMPAPIAGRVALNELVLHGWDIAAATGLPLAFDDAALRESQGLLASRADNPDDGAEIYGPVISVGPDAPLLDRVLGLAGRNPSWAAR